MTSSVKGERPSLNTNLAWGTVGPLAKMSIQLASQAALARLLTPTDYGVFAVAVLVTTLVSYLSEMGGAAGLVKKENLGVLDIRVAFGLQILIGVMASLSLYLGAGPIADIFKSPESKEILEILALNPLLMMLGVVSLRLLAREMRFKEIQLIGLASYVLGYAFIAVLMAWLKFGVYALVLGTLAQSILQLTLAYALSRHALQPAFTLKLVVDQMKFGAQTLTSGLLTWGLFSLDRLAVARLHPVAVTGYYSAAFNLVIAPPWQIVSSFQQILFSKASTDNQSNEGIKKLYTRMLFIILTMVLPASLLVSTSAPEIVAIMYGKQWAASAPLISILALALPFYAIAGLSTPFMWARNKIHYDLIMQAATICSLLIGVWLSRDASVEYIAIAMVASYILRAILAIWLTSSYLALEGALRLEGFLWLVIGAGVLVFVKPMKACLIDLNLISNPFLLVASLTVTCLAYILLTQVFIKKLCFQLGTNEAALTLMALSKLKQKLGQKLAARNWS